MKHFFLALSLIVVVWPASAFAKTERWSCQMQIGAKAFTQDWIISETKMTGVNEKEGLSLIYDSNQVVVAYSLTQKKGLPVTSFVYVLDKIAGKMINYDDLQAAVTAGAYGNVSAGIGTSPCKRVN